MSLPTTDSILLIVVIGVLLLINAGGVFLVVLQLPGTWLMLLATGLVAWWYYDAQSPLISLWTMFALVALAALGELVEFFGSSVGSSKAGGSRVGSILGLVLAIIGAVAGTALIPVPVLGTVLGACLGAGLGSVAGDRMVGRSWKQSLVAGKGAARGRLYGTIGKVAIAVMMWLVAATALMI